MINIGDIEDCEEGITERVTEYSGPEISFVYGIETSSYNGEVIPIGTKKLISGDGCCKNDKVLVDVGIDKLIEVEPIIVGDEDERKEIFSRNISLVRGLVESCGFDLSKFTTDKILERAPPDSKIEVRVQDPQKRFTNLVNGKVTWSSVASYEVKYIRDYAKYQKLRLEKEKESKLWDANSFCCKGKVKFGTNVDLQDPQRWEEQLAEMQKLPEWARLVSKEQNLLSYLDYSVLGVNTLQAYLKVRGCRTPAHQENSNFCSVNINIGPHDTEWFAVGYEDWRKVDELCNLKGISFPKDAWWPDIVELQKKGIKVYRVTQKPGDTVFVNYGCIHWVQAVGTCNNIAYNVGPLTPEQYEAAVVRYEANRVHRYKSIVPMKYLTWKFAEEFCGDLDDRLRQLMLYTMAVSIVEVKKLQKFCDEKGVKQIFAEDPFFVSLNVHHILDTLRFCVECKTEVFYLFFIKVGGVKRSKTLLLHCLKCALEVDSSMSVYKYYEQGPYLDIIEKYDRFRQPILERDAVSADR